MSPRRALLIAVTPSRSHTTTATSKGMSLSCRAYWGVLALFLVLPCAWWSDTGRGQDPPRLPSDSQQDLDPTKPRPGMSQVEVRRRLGPPGQWGRQILYRRYLEQWSMRLLSLCGSNSIAYGAKNLKSLLSVLSSPGHVDLRRRPIPISRQNCHFSSAAAYYSGGKSENSQVLHQGSSCRGYL